MATCPGEFQRPYVLGAERCSAESPICPSDHPNSQSGDWTAGPYLGWFEGPRVSCQGPGPTYQDHCYANIPTITTLEEKLKCCSGATSADNCDMNYCYVTGSGPGTGLSSDCNTLMSSYCQQPDASGVVNMLTDSNCQILKKSDPTLYNEILKQACTGNNLTTTACQNFCNQKDSNGNNLGYCQQALIDYCKNKQPGTNDQLCACYYPNSFYTSIRDKLSADYNVSPTLLSGLSGPNCVYPPCGSGNNIAPSKGQTCSDVNLTQCIQDVTLSNSGTVTNLNVNQNATGCTTLTKKSGGGTGGGTGGGCLIGQKLQNGVCVPDTTKVPAATPFIQTTAGKVTAGGVGLLLVIGIIFLILMITKSKK